MKTKENADHIALFIDLDNFVGFCLELGLPIDLSPEIERLTELGKITIRRSFGDIYKAPLTREQQGDLRKMLQKNQIQHEDIPYQNNFKNGSDIRLSVETVSTAFSNDDIEMFAIVAKDRDYLPLFSKLREMGKEIIGIAGDRDSTPELYVKACDYFYYHEALTSVIPRPLIKEASKSDRNINVELSGLIISKFNKDDAVKLLVDAIKAMDAKGSSIIAGDTVIYMMRRLKPDFDFNIYGFNNFKELCEYAQESKVIKIKHHGAAFNLQLNDQEIKNQHPVSSSEENKDQNIESGVDQLNRWFENKVRIQMPDLSQRKIIYEQLFHEGIYSDGITLTDLSKKIELNIAKSQIAQEACYKILYSLYRAGCFFCIPGTTYNPIVKGISIKANDYSSLDIRFIKNSIRVYRDEHQTNADASSWSELFFGSKSKDMESVIQEIMRSL